MISYYKENSCNKTMIEIVSDEQDEIKAHNEVVKQYHSIYNRQGTNGELHPLGDTSGYVITTDELFYKYLISSELAKIQQERDPEINLEETPKEWETEAEERAKQIFAAIQQKKILY